MTAQVADHLEHEAREYSIAAIENEWPFKPKDHGFEPKTLNTACRRGYYCRYAVVDGALFLTQMNVATGPTQPKPWLGVVPIKGEFSKFDGTWEYRDLKMPVPYSGGVVCGADFLSEFYVHMGFHRPHCYEAVIELLFDAGMLKQVRDHSEEMERLRARMREHGGPSPRPSRNDIEQFVDDAFSLSYEKKWDR